MKSAKKVMKFCVGSAMVLGSLLIQPTSAFAGSNGCSQAHNHSQYVGSMLVTYTDYTMQATPKPSSWDNSRFQHGGTPWAYYWGSTWCS
jgi:hypothetical protein